MQTLERTASHRKVFLLGVFCALAIVATAGSASAANSRESMEGNIDWYVALEVASDSNVNLSDVNPVSDGRITPYGGISYSKDNGVTDIELGLKVSNNTYFENDQLDSSAVQIYANARKATYNGALDAMARYSDLTDAVSQDLLLTGQIRRLTGAGLVDWEAEWQRTDLKLDASFERTIYTQDIFSPIDNNVLHAGFALGRELSPKTNLYFAYSHKNGNYDDPSRIDFDADSFGVTVRYGEEEKLALEANLSFTTVTPEIGEAQDTATGSLKATWDIERERTRLMVGYARDILPASTGSYSINGLTTVSFTHAFNESLSGELAGSYEVGDYQNVTATTVTRLGFWGGLSMAFGSRTLTYLKVKWMSRDGDGGSGLNYDDTTLVLGVKYGF
jgi:hypothetical protein